MDRWDFSWDLNPGPPQKSMAAIIPVDKPEKFKSGGENTAAEKGKALKLAKGGAFQLQISLFQRSRNTPVFIGQLLPFPFAPSHCPYRKRRIIMKFPINLHSFRSSVQRYYEVEIEIVGRHNCSHYRSFKKILRLSDWGVLKHLKTRRQDKPAAISLET